MRLEDRAVVAVSGPDAREFLQGLITNDLRRLHTPCYAALLTPQGKILFDFLIGEQNGAFLLDCAAEFRDAFVKRLSLYRLRAKIEITPRDDLAVVWHEEGVTNSTFWPDPRHKALGSRAIMPETDGARGGKQFEMARLDAGVPEGRDFGQDKIFALDGDLDELHGIAFDKGCYVGQELTARMKHKGTVRKRLLPVRTAAGTDLPSPGSAIAADGREVGAIQSVYGQRGFALMRLDRLAEAEGAALRAQDTGVTIDKPAWLFA